MVNSSGKFSILQGLENIDWISVTPKLHAIFILFLNFWILASIMIAANVIVQDIWRCDWDDPIPQEILSS